MRAAHAAAALSGTLGETVMGGELMRGRLFAEWEVAACMYVTRNDLKISDHRPDVAFGLIMETSVPSSAMLAEIQGL